VARVRRRRPDFTLHQGFTYSGHPVACAAGSRPWTSSSARASSRRSPPGLGPRSPSDLASDRLPRDPDRRRDPRVDGLMAAIEIVADRAARRAFLLAQVATPG
jgi:adenosylmethionine-8-amino-7-oxononanoate aminotransferase